MKYPSTVTKVIWKHVINPKIALGEGEIFDLPWGSKIISCMFDVKVNAFVFWTEIPYESTKPEFEAMKEKWLVRMHETGKTFVHPIEMQFVGTMNHFSGYMAHLYVRKMS